MNAAGTLRRRIHHEDVGGRPYDREESSAVDGLSEPLLGRRSSSDYDDDYNDDDSGREWSSTKWREEQVWARNVSKLLAQWAQWFSTVVVAGTFRVTNNLVMAVLGRGDSHAKEYHLSPLQEQRLEALQLRLAVPFDGSQPAHQDALKALWRGAFPSRPMPGLVSPLWKDMGWQGTDPSTDFRGGGFISLENLLFFSRRYPVVFQRLLNKEQGKRAEWEYPFAVGGLNVTFMLIQMLELRGGVKPTSVGSVSGAFFNILAADEDAFDVLYCVAFQMLDKQWLALGASYMEFNAVLQSTRAQLEKELALEDVERVEDLPSYIALLNAS